MTKNRDQKELVRARMAKTGESYTAARARLVGAQAPGMATLTPEAGALARLVPLSEALLFGLGGGIGAAYFLFEYKTFTSVYVGGRINPYVQKRDFLEVACERAGVPAVVRTTATPRVADKQLRAALAEGPAVVVVDMALLPFPALPRAMAGSAPHTLLVELRDDEPWAFDLAPQPFRFPWAELAEARARHGASKHRLMTVGAPAGGHDLAGGVRAAIAETARGMLEPPLSNFGVSGLERWADAMVAPGKKGWPAVFRGGRRLVSALGWLHTWIEGAWTGGGGNHRELYARFLEAAADITGRAALRAVAGQYRALATAWRELARAVLPERVPLLAQLRALAERRSQLLRTRGAAAAGELETVTRERDELAARFAESAPPGLDPPELFADLAPRVGAIAAAEKTAAVALAAAGDV